MEVFVLGRPLGIQSLLVVSISRVKMGGEIVPEEEVHVVTLDVVVEEQRSKQGAFFCVECALESSLHLVVLVLALHHFTDTFVDPFVVTSDVNGSAFAVAEVGLEGVLFTSHGAGPPLSLNSDGIGASVLFIVNFLGHLDVVLSISD